MSRKGPSGMSNPPGVTWDAKGTQEFLQNELDKYGLGISKEKLADKVQMAAQMNGGHVAVLNEKYLTVYGKNGEVDFSFTKSKAEGKWKLTPVLKYGDVTKGYHVGVIMYKARGQWYANKKDAEMAVLRWKLG